MKLAILQARLTSSRLPGKVLATILGKPMILHQIERIQRSKQLDDLVVATSDHDSDDELAEVLEENGVTVRRGPLENVFERFARVIDEYKPETIIRLTGDNPLTDPDVIDLVLSEHLKNGADYTSNSRVRSFPYGLDVECIRHEAFNRLRKMSLDLAEREHVTMGFYRRPEIFTICSVVQEEDASELRWSVDYPEDFVFVTSVYNYLYTAKPSFGQADVLELISRRPELRHTLSDVLR